MLNRSLKSIAFSSSAALLIASLGTHALGAGEESRGCRDLDNDITALRLAVGVIDGKVDRSNLSSAATLRTLGILDGKVDQSNQSSAAIKLALGVVDGKVSRSNADLAILRGELLLIRDALLAQAQLNGGLQLQVEVNDRSCASGAIQCASATPPSSFNQIPVELKLLVLRDQLSVTNLQVDDFDMLAAFAPDGGPDVSPCSSRGRGCGSPDFFINRGNGGYQMWVHPQTRNWVSGAYSLLLRVTDTEGHVATRLVNVPIAAGTGDPRVPPVTDAPGSSLENERSLDAVN